MKKFALLLLILSLPFNYALYHTHLKRTQGFAIDKITPYARDYNPVWDIAYSDDELNTVQTILRQPFSYFGSGKTCYVFLSQDKKFVIKLFKQKHMRPFSIFEKMLGFAYIPYCCEKLAHRLQTRNKLFSSFKIAHNYLKNKTGLVYLHLQPTNNLNQMLYFTDKEGRPFTFDADSMEFLIQKCASRTFPALTQMIESKNERQAMAAIDSIRNLIQVRCEKGIDDDDNNCERNIGLINGQAVEIDIGEFTLNPSITEKEMQNHIAIAMRDLYKFLEENHPIFYESIQNPH